MLVPVRCIVLVLAAAAALALPVPEVHSAQSLAPTTFVRGVRYNPIGAPVQGEGVQLRGIRYPPMSGLPEGTAVPPHVDDTENGVRYPPMVKRQAVTVVNAVPVVAVDLTADDAVVVEGVRYPPMCTPGSEDSVRRSVAGAPTRLHPMTPDGADRLRRGVRYPPMECEPDAPST